MRISLVPERCCGAAQCVGTAPEVFDQGEDGLVLLLDPTPPDALREQVREAAEYCPSRAITVVE
ncbi:ferredoxin [Streptomyces sp. NPDC052109]|uniref:ferredoxin n=1 Tax=Streptomyces sp. NPDC052109 TaxID=3155527 RepID=UPI0034190C08